MPKTPRYLSSREAAKFMGLKPAAFRSAVRYAEERGVQLRANPAVWPAGNLPVYDPEALADYRDRIQPKRLWPIPLEEQKARRAARQARSAQGAGD